MNLYPLFLKPIHKETVWGGTKIRDNYFPDAPLSVIGETAILTSGCFGSNEIKNGAYEGRTLKELFEADNHIISKYEEFSSLPILIKIIDAREPLSIQVHPDKKAASELGGKSKNESWHILSAECDAYIYKGFKDNAIPDVEDILAGIKNGTLEDLLKKKKIKVNETIDLPAGTVHSIGAGITLFEIQENSDTTYRLYDFNRDKKRELHINEAIHSILPEQKGALLKRPPTKSPDGYTVEVLCTNSMYTSVKIVNAGEYNGCVKGVFQHIFFIDGNGCMETEAEHYHFNKGDSVFLPAQMGKYSITGGTEFIVSTL